MPVFVEHDSTNQITVILRSILQERLRQEIVNIDYTKITIPYYFFVKLNELNSIFGQLQLDNLRCIEPKEKFVNWCSEFSIPI